MKELTVQLERLEPLRVAVVAVTSETPEDDAVSALLDWARPQGLLDAHFRVFGYDNCQPHPNHTYTSWLSVGQEVRPSDGIEIEDFPGGLFAVTEVQGVEQIAPAWQQMTQWLRASDYTYGGQPGLEECLNRQDDPAPAEMRFRLYLSLKD